MAAAAGLTDAIGRRARAWGRPPRVLGVDVARGLAMVGMFAAHVAVQPEFVWTADTTAGLSDGKPSALFAVLAGVAIAILGRRPDAVSVISIRAVAVYLVGLLLILLPTGVAIILPAYAALFLLAMPFRRAAPGRLAVAALVLAVVAPVLVLPLREPLQDAPGALRLLVLDPLITGYYPALIWIAYVLGGVAIGRLELLRVRTAIGLVVVGAALSAIGYTAGAVAETMDADRPWHVLFIAAPHSDTPFDLIGTGGFAVGALGVCLLVTRALAGPSLSGPGRWVLLPLGAIGAMALSAYSAHLVVIAALRIPVPGDDPTDTAFWVLTAGMAVACSAWVLLLGRGPLEAALNVLGRGGRADTLDGAHEPGRNGN